MTPSRIGAAAATARATPLGRARLSVGAVFLVHAAVVGTLAPRIPAIKANLDLSDGVLGAALTGFAAGLFAGTRIAAWLVERFGSRGIVRAALPVLAVSLAGPGLAGDVVGLTGALIVLGVASGLLDVAMNAQAVVVERAYRRPILSSLHGVWSVGVLGASALASAAAAAGIGVPVHFGVAAAVLVAASVVAPLALLPSADERAHGGEADAGPRGRRGWWRAAAALGTIGFCSFLGEGAAADWSGVYLQQNLGTSGGVAALGFTAFAVGMVAGRFSGDRLSIRLGPVSVVRAGGLVAGLGLALGLVIAEPGAALVAWALLGLGLSVVVPIAFSAAGNLDGGSAALGWVVTLSYVGSVAGPAAIGFVAEVMGLRSALLIPAVLAAVVGVLASSVRTAAGEAREAARAEATVPR